MLLMLLEKKAQGSHIYPLDEVVFYDTGMEFGAIYHVRDQIKEVLDYYEVPLTVLKPERPFMYDMLERPVHSKQKGDHFGYGWCGGLCRWGTRNKLDALDKYAREKDAVVYIGIASDEPNRLTRMEDYKRAPLAEWGITEKEALEYCWSRGIHWTENNDSPDLYTLLDRVSCWCCPLQNLNSLRVLYHDYPYLWKQLKEMDDKATYKFKPDYSVQQLEEKFQKEDYIKKISIPLFDVTKHLD